MHPGYLSGMHIKRLRLFKYGMVIRNSHPERPQNCRKCCILEVLKTFKLTNTTRFLHQVLQTTPKLTEKLHLGSVSKKMRISKIYMIFEYTLSNDTKTKENSYLELNSKHLKSVKTETVFSATLPNNAESAEEVAFQMQIKTREIDDTCRILQLPLQLTPKTQEVYHPGCTLKS